MATFPKALEHRDLETKDDEALRKEAQVYLGASAPLQLVAELIATVRPMALSWWSPELLRGSFSATTRFEWLRERADLRQRITSSLTGLATKTARRTPHATQAALIASALDEGDVTAVTFEEVFEPRDLAVYGAAQEYWSLFRERMPWDDDAPAHKELVTALLKALLAEKSAVYPELSRAPVLSALDARSAIDSVVWQTRMPLEIRAAIDDARLRKERVNPEVPAKAENDLAIATPEIIVANVPLKDLKGIFLAAEAAMGMAGAEAAQGTEPGRTTSRPRGTTRPPLRRSGIPTPAGATEVKAVVQAPAVPKAPPTQNDVELIVVDDEEVSEEETRQFLLKTFPDA